MKQRIFSAMQPTGSLHLGNYIGTMKNWLLLQDKYDDLIFCIADLHAMTTNYQPSQLSASVRQLFATYIALGIDPKKCIVFRQSDVEDHTLLSWILGCITTTGTLNRMTQFKSKTQKNISSLGLYGYPALMAADILLYRSTLVPVGGDQKQHLELAGQIANTFNRTYEINFFQEPKPLIPQKGARVMSLLDATSKMSKSDASEGSRINITDSPDTIKKKISKAKTDNILGFDSESLKERPEARNLITIYESIAEEALPSNINNFSQLKALLTEALVSKLDPIKQTISQITNDNLYISHQLKQGKEKAKNLSCIKEVRELVGLN